MKAEVTTVTWERLTSFARRLEASARGNAVTPEDGSRLVRLVLEFDRNLRSHAAASNRLDGTDDRR
jgi:hypothetical protein